MKFNSNIGRFETYKLDKVSNYIIETCTIFDKCDLYKMYTNKSE